MLRLALGIMLLMPMWVCAKEVSAPSAPPQAPAESQTETSPLLDAIGVIDTPRDYLAEKFVYLIGGIDSFFGSDRNYQETNDSVVQLDISRVMGYTGEQKFVLQGRAKVHLPKAEQTLHLLIESNPDKNTTSEPIQNQVVQPGSTQTPGSYGAGLRYEKTKDERWHFSTDGGLKFQGLNTTPFARARASYDLPLEQWRLKAAETAFWFNTIGVGETTQLDLERIFSDALLFRATSNATWLHDQQSFSLSQNFSVFQTLNERTKAQYQVGAVGTSRPITVVTDYYVSLLVRHRLRREWMYFELSPQLHFPKDRNFKSSGLLSVRLEILFDKSQ